MYWYKRKKGNIKDKEVFLIEEFEDVLKIFKICSNLKDTILKDKKILIYDEQFTIIGYK
jgi:hypothetical protein